MGYSGYLDIESKSILLEYQNNIVKKEESFLNLYYRLLNEQTTANVPTPITTQTGEPQQQASWSDVPSRALSDAWNFVSNKWKNFWSSGLGFTLKLADPTGLSSWPDLYNSLDYLVKVSREGADPITIKMAQAMVIIDALCIIPNAGILAGGVGAIGFGAASAEARSLAKGLRAAMQAAIKAGDAKTMFPVFEETILKLTENPKAREWLIKAVDGFIKGANNPVYKEYLTKMKQVVETRSLSPFMTEAEKNLIKDSYIVKAAEKKLDMYPKPGQEQKVMDFWVNVLRTQPNSQLAQQFAQQTSKIPLPGGIKSIFDLVKTYPKSAAATVTTAGGATAYGRNYSAQQAGAQAAGRAATSILRPKGASYYRQKEDEITKKLNF